MADFSDFTRQDIERILGIVDRLGDVEIEFQAGDVKLFVRKQSAPTPPSSTPRTIPQREPSADVGIDAQPQHRSDTPVPAGTSAGSASSGVPSGSSAIRAPMLGRFFRAPSPNDPPFVEVGSHVEPDDPVAVIEVMKLFNTVKAGMRGTITVICQENAAMVEFDQPLFVVKPD